VFIIKGLNNSELPYFGSPEYILTQNL